MQNNEHQIEYLEDDDDKMFLKESVEMLPNALGSSSATSVHNELPDSDPKNDIRNENALKEIKLPSVEFAERKEVMNTLRNTAKCIHKQKSNRRRNDLGNNPEILQIKKEVLELQKNLLECEKVYKADMHKLTVENLKMDLQIKKVKLQILKKSIANDRVKGFYNEDAI